MFCAPSRAGPRCSGNCTACWSRPGGSVFSSLVAQTEDLGDVPEGNSFPTQAELVAVLKNTGFMIGDQVDDPGNAPVSWTRLSDRVDAYIRQQHQHEKAFRQEAEQQGRLDHLLSTGQLSSQILLVERHQFEDSLSNLAAAVVKN